MDYNSAIDNVVGQPHITTLASKGGGVNKLEEKCLLGSLDEDNSFFSDMSLSFEKVFFIRT